jgi:hypothetical protein
MTDDELLRAFEDLSLPPERFGHAEHVRVAWMCLRLEEPPAAIARFVRGLRAFAAHAGSPDRYHETITWAYLLLIGERLGSPDEGFEALVARHPELLDRRLLERHYRPETLASPRARRRFVLPDLR